MDLNVDTQPDDNSGKDPIGQLKKHVTFIEHKFLVGRGKDITPKIADDIAMIIVSIRYNTQNGKNRDLQPMLLDIEDHCYAASSYYTDDDNRRSHFYAELRRIVVILKGLLSLLDDN